MRMLNWGKRFQSTLARSPPTTEPLGSTAAANLQLWPDSETELTITSHEGSPRRFNGLTSTDCGMKRDLRSARRVAIEDRRRTNRSTGRWSVETLSHRSRTRYGSGHILPTNPVSIGAAAAFSNRCTRADCTIYVFSADVVVHRTVPMFTITLVVCCVTGQDDVAVVEKSVATIIKHYIGFR